MATLELQQFKVTSLPTTLVANAIYYVGSSTSSTGLDIYVVDSLGVAARHTLNTTDVENTVNSAIAASNQLSVVATITERNALAPTACVWVYVEDASEDTSVASGGATYLYKPSNSTWIKANEAESLDVVLSWSGLQNKPVSSVTAIDAAVTASHTHTNQAALDQVTPLLKSPSFTYSQGKLSNIVYSDGSTKTLTYTNNYLTRVDLVRNGVIARKDFVYVNKILTNIIETVI